MQDDDTEAGLVEGLERAIAEDHIAPWFQPVMCPNGIELLSAEALPRWDDPVKGVIPAGVFIEAAIRHGLLGRIGRILVGKSCAAYATWRDRGIAPAHVGVNFTGAELASGVAVEVIRWATDAAGIRPDQISAEVAEDVLDGEGWQARVAALRAMHALGVRLCLDDFGSGACEPANIARAPFSMTKVDRRIVGTLDEDPDSVDRLKTLVGAAQGAGLAIIAKGVETRAQIDILSGLGCDGQQGFAIARPMPEDAFVEWLDLNTWPAAPAEAGLRAG